MKVIFALIVALLSTSAHAGSVNATCAEAQASYNAYGRINVRTERGAVVPVYGLVKKCPVFAPLTPVGYSVRTHDKNRCVLGYRCIPVAP